MKDQYTENSKTLMKEIEEDTNKWKDIPGSWIGRINIVKMSIPPKVVYRLNVTLIKVPVAFSTEIEQITLKFAWNHKRLQVAEATLRKKNKAGSSVLPVLPSEAPLAMSGDVFGCRNLGE